MRKNIYLYILVMVATAVLASCGSSKRLAAPKEGMATEAPAAAYLSSKLRLTVPAKQGTVSVNGVMKMKSRERVQLSLLMPILRTEMVRMEITPDEVLLVDRMNKRYVRATKRELRNVLSKHVEFARLEKLLYEASQPDGKAELSGQELGIPALEKARIRLYGFSTDEFTIYPTELTDKYRQVSLEEVVELLKELL